MAGEALGTERRIGGAQRADQRRQRPVLRLLVRRLVGAFELDSDREIVAGAAPLVARFPGVPGAFSKRHVLRDRAIAPDQRVRIW